MVFSSSRTFPGSRTRPGPEAPRVETVGPRLFLSAAISDEMARQDRGYPSDVTQRRDEDREDRQAEEEILAEGAANDLGLQIFVAGGDQADVDCRVSLPPTRSNCFARSPAAPSLQRLRQIADLVQEERPLVRRSPNLPLGRHAPVKALFLVTNSYLSRSPSGSRRSDRQDDWRLPPLR